MMAKTKVSRLKITKKTQNTMLVVAPQDLLLLLSLQGHKGTQGPGMREFPSALLQQRRQHLQQTSGHVQSQTNNINSPTPNGATKTAKLAK
mmetsp:Transcript_14791/g.32011  ORF Transcript_14791/g.32011 Transcript_14791/m.32011 type:complete len:91 (+) Transcript_14791:545-817(+)